MNWLQIAKCKQKITLVKLPFLQCNHSLPSIMYLLWIPLFIYNEIAQYDAILDTNVALLCTLLWHYVPYACFKVHVNVIHNIWFLFIFLHILASGRWNDEGNLYILLLRNFCTWEEISPMWVKSITFQGERCQFSGNASFFHMWHEYDQGEWVRCRRYWQKQGSNSFCFILFLAPTNSL